MERDADTMSEDCPPECRVLPVFAGRGDFWRDEDAGRQGNKQAQFSQDRGRGCGYFFNGAVRCDGSKHSTCLWK